MKKSSKRGLFDDKRITLLCSVLVALLAWVIVAGFINPGDERTIPNVGIDYTKRASEYQGKNLQIVGDFPAQYAEVRVSGDGSVISGFASTDVMVYADYSGVSDEGTHVVPLRYDKVAPGNYSITGCSIKTPEHSLQRKPQVTVTLTFERVSTKALKIDVRSDGVVPAGGFVKDPAQPSTLEVNMTGPKSSVDRVSKVEAIITDEVELLENAIYSGIPLTLLDEMGNKLDVDELDLTLSVESVEVTIRILEIRDISLSVGFVGVQQNFDTQWLQSRIRMSATSMKVVGTTEALSNLGGMLKVGDIDISSLTLGWEPQQLLVQLPEDNANLQNYEQLKTVTVSFDSTDLVEKDFEIPNITVKSQPQGVTVTPTMQTVTNVTLIGPADQIEALLPENITVEIDAFGVTVNKGAQQIIPARIIIPGADRVFATGSYPQICDVALESENSEAG